MVDEACIHPPQYLVTKILPEVPHYFPNFGNFLGPVAASTRNAIAYLPPPPPVPVGMRGEVRPFRPLRPKFHQGFPPIFQNVKNYWPIAASSGTPVASLTPLPPVPVGVHGGVRPL